MTDIQDEVSHSVEEALERRSLESIHFSVEEDGSIAYSPDYSVSADTLVQLAEALHDLPFADRVVGLSFDRAEPCDAMLCALPVLPSLRFASLEGGAFTDVGVAALGIQPCLSGLLIAAYRSFTGEGLMAIPAERPIRWLNLDGSYFVEDVAVLAACRFSELNSFSVWCGDNLTDAAVAKLGGLTELTELDLKACGNLTGEFLWSLKNLKQLTRLDIRQNPKLLDEHIIALNALPQLEYIDMAECDSLTLAGMNRLFEVNRKRVLVGWHALHEADKRQRRERRKAMRKRRRAKLRAQLSGEQQ